MSYERNSAIDAVLIEDGSTVRLRINSIDPGIVDSVGPGDRFSPMKTGGVSQSPYYTISWQDAQTPSVEFTETSLTLYMKRGQNLVFPHVAILQEPDFVLQMEGKETQELLIEDEASRKKLLGDVARAIQEFNSRWQTGFFQ